MQEADCLYSRHTDAKVPCLPGWGRDLDYNQPSIRRGGRWGTAPTEQSNDLLEREGQRLDPVGAGHGQSLKREQGDWPADLPGAAQEALQESGNSRRKGQGLSQHLPEKASAGAWIHGSGRNTDKNQEPRAPAGPSPLSTESGLQFHRHHPRRPDRSLLAVSHLRESPEMKGPANLALVCGFRCWQPCL